MEREQGEQLRTYIQHSFSITCVGQQKSRAFTCLYLSLLTGKAVSDRQTNLLNWEDIPWRNLVQILLLGTLLRG